VAPSFLFSQFMGGLTTAMFLFLIASGLSLIFGVTRIVNFAHGSFYMLAAYLTYSLAAALPGGPAAFYLAALLAALAVAAVGGLVEVLLLRRVYRAPELYQLLLTFALVLVTADLVRYRHGDLVRTAGAVIVRQRPGTAKGLLFLTLEDETGMSQAIISPDLLQQHRQLIVGSPGLVVEGVLQKRDGSISVRGERFWAIEEMLAVPSHDFR